MLCFTKALNDINIIYYDSLYVNWILDRTMSVNDMNVRNNKNLLYISEHLLDMFAFYDW
jgi:hypothetical protein